MIQDSDIEVLDNVYCIPINPELLIKEGFELKEQSPSIRDIHYIHKDLDIRLTQYDNRTNRVVAESGYPYAFTTKFITPAIIASTQTNAFNYSIYTYGQLLAIIEAKTKLNDLQKCIETEVEDIVSTVYLANKYKRSK